MIIDKSKDLKFWTSAITNPETGCIEWQLYKNKQGYGVVTRLGFKWMAHRWAWMLYKGSVAQDLCVLHKCDNPSCVNLNHLFVGTHAQNMQDRAVKGRGVYSSKIGCLNNNSSMTEDKVKQVRALYPLIEVKNLKLVFNLTHQNIYSILNRKTWTHIPPLTEQETLYIREQWASQYT